MLAAVAPLAQHPFSSAGTGGHGGTEDSLDQELSSLTINNNTSDSSSADVLSTTTKSGNLLLSKHRSRPSLSSSASHQHLNFSQRHANTSKTSADSLPSSNSPSYFGPQPKHSANALKSLSDPHSSSTLRSPPPPAPVDSGTAGQSNTGNGAGGGSSANSNPLQQSSSNTGRFPTSNNSNNSSGSGAEDMGNGGPAKVPAAPTRPGGGGGGRGQKYIHTYQAGFPTYGLHWSQRPGEFKLGFGSFLEDINNKVQVIQMFENSGEFVKLAEFEHPYPPTKFMWSPFKGGPAPDLFATSGDYLRIFELVNTDIGGVVEGVENLGVSGKPSSASIVGSAGGPDGNYQIQGRAILNSARRVQNKKEYCSPLTAFDWNEANPALIITSSIDTTCTVWDVNTQQAKTQLIAHDREVYDVAFARGTDIFASVGADGSVRMFDLRALEHSTIIYETNSASKQATHADIKGVPETSSLLRLAWNRQDPNYIATFEIATSTILILDVRVPAVPVTELHGHGAAVNSLAWAPHSSAHICTVADDAFALVWDISQMSKQRKIMDPLLTYRAEGEINQVSWSATHSDWVAIGYGSTIQALKV